MAQIKSWLWSLQMVVDLDGQFGWSMRVERDTLQEWVLQLQIKIRFLNRKV